MKKSIAAQQPRRRQPDTNAVLGEDLGTFLRILVNLSATLRDLGYPDEGEMLMGVKADILERLRETATFPN
jgi:hypothetical protein